MNNIVLVHGGFVDGAGWEGVYTRTRWQPESHGASPVGEKSPWGPSPSSGPRATADPISRPRAGRKSMGRWQEARLRLGPTLRRTSALVTEWSQNWGHSAKLSC